VKKGIVVAFGGLMFLAGCGDGGTKSANIPAQPKWKGAPYHIEFDAPPAKPNPAGLTIPSIKYTANPDALETRASLIVRFDASSAKSAAKSDQPVQDQMILGATDLSGAQGALSADYIDLADKGLARLLGAYCMKGKVKINVALVRSSISPQAGNAEVNSKRLSDWLPIELPFKNPHPKC